ncbi:MAG: RHS repeat-associated core domain-containing protein, partial [Myxococcota bacterium]
GLDDEGIPALGIPLEPQSITVADDGSLYIATAGQVRRVLADGSWERVAGTGTPGFAGAGSFGGVARDTPIGLNIVGLEVNSSGDLFIADQSNRIIWMVRDGNLHRVVGNPLAVSNNLDLGFAANTIDPLQHPDNGQYIMQLSKGQNYPQNVNLACLANIHLANSGQGLWIVQSCGSNGQQRIRYAGLAGDLTELDNEVWVGQHPVTAEYYTHPARVSHKVGWPYPSWFDFADRPEHEVGGENPAHHDWGWSGQFNGDDLPSPASVTFGEEWAIWDQPHSLASVGNTLYVAEGLGNGDVSRIRKVRLGTGTTTLGRSISISADDDGVYPCNSLHCSWEVTGDDGIEEAIGAIASLNGKLYYSTLTNNSAGVFAQGGGGKDGLPGTRILGGGDQNLEDEQLMVPALDYNLLQPVDIAFGPDGSLYVADGVGHKVVRLAVVSTAAYDSNIVASADGSEYYVFDELGRHLATRDSATHVPLYTFAYDDAGLLATITDRDSQVTTINRDPSGAPLSIESPSGVLTTLSLDTDGYLGQVSAPSGDGYKLRYGQGGLLEYLTSPAGRVSAFTYDDTGRLLEDRDPSGRIQTLSLIEHTPENRLIRHVAPGGTITDYAVELQGSEDEVLFTQTWPDETQSSRQVFADGRVTMTNRSGVVTHVSYETHPQFGPTASYVSSVEVITPGGGPTVTAEREIIIDPGCTLFVAEPCDSVMAADPELYPDRITEITTLNGDPGQRILRRFTRAHSADGLDLPAENMIVSAENRALRLVLNSVGRPDLAQFGTWDGSDFVHGGLDDLFFTYHPDGSVATRQEGQGGSASVQSFAYLDTLNGLEVTATQAGESITVAFDSDGWLSSIATAIGTTAIELDGDGYLTGYQPPLDGNHVFHPAVDDETASYLPAPGTAIAAPLSYAYGIDGQLSSVIETGAAVTNMSYDGAGRLDQITSSDGLISMTYNGAGRLGTVSDPAGGTLTFGYSNGMLHSLTRNGAETAAADRTITWQMNGVMQLGSESVAGAAPINYEYDGDGLPLVAGALTIQRQESFAAVDIMDLGVVHTDIDYDQRMRPALISYSAGGVTLYQATLSYNDHGRLDTVVESVTADGVSAGPSTTMAYGYDPAGRLSTVHVDGMASEAYSYGAHYDWSSVTRGGLSENPSFDGNGRLSGLDGHTYGYDTFGRRTTRTGGGDVSYTYGAAGQLTAVTTAAETIGYTHDGIGRRVSKRVDGALQRGWLYRSRYQPVAELDATGAVVSRFVYATRTNVPDYMVRDGNTYQLISDVRGSVRLVVDVANGTIAQRIDYDTWGRVISDSSPGFQPFGFAGGLYDPDTGLLHFGARDYDPAVGRFVQIDPRLFGGGYDNLHAYAGFDPINYSDRTGEIPEWVMDAFTWAD